MIDYRNRYTVYLKRGHGVLLRTLGRAFHPVHAGVKDVRSVIGSFCVGLFVARPMVCHVVSLCRETLIRWVNFRNIS